MQFFLVRQTRQSPESWPPTSRSNLLFIPRSAHYGNFAQPKALLELPVLVEAKISREIRPYTLEVNDIDDTAPRPVGSDNGLDDNSFGLQ